MHWALSVSTLLVFGSTASAYSFERARMINKRQVQDEYDYIVVGSGHAGSVISSRLSEDPNVSVLVIEAGILDAGEDFITIPKNAGGAMGTKYDWSYKTVASSTINNRVITVPAGKVVGGGTVLNGMAFDRGAAADYDAWDDLGNEGWSFSELLPWFKKSETFTPPDPELASQFNITYEPEAHGTDGPIFASYPRFFSPVVNNWFRGLASLGIPLENDGANGRALNAFWAPNALHPTNMVRSYARPGYYDPATTRSNFHVLLENQVTKLVGSGSPVKITGVEYAKASGQTVNTVKARKEVIVAAGAIGSPKILQLSGIGPAALSQKLGITSLVDLPGVGSNYQDHSYSMTFNILGNAPPQIDDATAKQLYETQKTGPWTTSGPTAFAFLPLSKMADASRTQALISAAKAQSPAQYLRAGTPQAVVDGFAKQMEVLTTRLNTDTMAASELVFSGGSIMLSQQHPFSRGYVEITTKDPWTTPAIDFRYGSNPLDFDFVSETIRFSRKALATAPLQELRPQELSPGPQQTTDAQLKTWQQGQISTMFHSCCTNPMQPRNLGGVVDSNGVVYGTSNLRVVDASIMPLIPATHPQSTVYALAEKIADAIKKTNA